LDQPYRVLALKFAYEVSEADPMSMPKEISTSSYERVVDIYQYLGG
jgi:hypothetical protein